LAIGVGSSTQSIGPLVLMIVFLVATIGWHIWLRRSLKKMELDMAENDIYASSPFHREGFEAAEKSNVYSNAGHISRDGYDQDETKIEHLQNYPSGERRGMFARIKAYFTESPETAAQNAITQVAPHLSSPVREYTQQEHDEAYVHPAIISECPIIWIAKDKHGLSTQEIRVTTDGEEYTMTDEGAEFNEKGKVVWKQDELRDAPIWEDEPVY
jgi:hypothetical protein